MSELTLTLLRLGYLALLWVLVVSITLVLRRDLFGVQVTRRAAAVTVSGPAAPRGADPRRTLRTLVVTDGALRGTSIALGASPILLGRSPECTLVLEDDYASGRHARFYNQDGVWFVEDLGSTNGTFLGRAKVEAPTPVDAGVPVRVGRTVLELRR